MKRPKLIVLNGFAGSGKTTIAKRYIADNPLTLLIEGDELIVNIGQWLTHEEEARRLIYELSKQIADTHLTSGNDVIIPYLITDNAHLISFREIAQKHDASFYNFLLFNEKEVAIGKLLERGSWGEAGTDPIGDTDMPVISDLYDKMASQLEAQTDAIIVAQQDRTIDQTYSFIVGHMVQ